VKKSEQNFLPLHMATPTARLGDAFLGFFKMEASPVESQLLQQKEKKRRKKKGEKRIHHLQPFPIYV